MRKNIKKIVINLTLILIFILLFLIGCDKTTYYENGVPTYFLEPENYVIAKVTVANGIFADKLYGYISNEDYQKYIDGELNGVLVIKNPYEENRSVTANSDSIKKIEIGIYEDYRDYD